MVNKRLVAASSAVATFFIFRNASEYAVKQSILWTFSTMYFSVLAIAYTYSMLIYPHFLTPLRHLPSPKGGNFLMGHFRRIFKEPSGAPHKQWMAEVPNNGVIYYRNAFNAERVMPTSIEAIKEVLQTKSYEFIKPSQIREGLGRVLGIGVLLAEGDEHKRQRKALMPAFHYRHIKDLYPVFWSKSKELVAALDKFIDASNTAESNELPTVSIADWSSRATLDIIGTGGMGYDFGAIDNPDGELVSTYRTIVSPSNAQRYLQVISLVVPLWILRALPLKRNEQVMGAIRTIKKTARNLIHSKNEKLEKGLTTDTDIISVAIESGGFSEDDLVNQLMTFLAAGHETTASTMSWSIYVLSRHPEILTRLREEVREKLPSIADPDAPPATAQDIDSLPYLSAVCNEILRFYPPVGVTLRLASKDTTIVGHFIPKDTVILIPIWAINTSKEFWGEDADQFNPDRWLAPGQANSGGAQSNFANATFLHGPRSCIGQAFAKAEYQCLLASLVGRYDIEAMDLDKPLDIGGGVTMKPKGGVPVKLKKIEGW